MNCCSKSGIQKYAPSSNINVQITHRVVMFSSVDPPDDREDCFRVRHCGWRHVCRLCDHSFLSAFGLPGWSDLLNALGFPVAFLKAMGFTVTSSSWKLQVSVSERSTVRAPSFVATSFPVAVSINPPRYLAVALENSTLRRISNFFSSCFHVSP